MTENLPDLGLNKREGEKRNMRIESVMTTLRHLTEPTRVPHAVFCPPIFREFFRFSRIFGQPSSQVFYRHPLAILYLMIKLEVNPAVRLRKLNNPQIRQLPVDSVVVSWTVEPVAFSYIVVKGAAKGTKGLVSLECLDRQLSFT